VTGSVTILDGTANLSGYELSNFQISPNPSKDAVVLSFVQEFQGSIHLSDASGRILQTRVTNHETTIHLDLSGFAAGTYMISLVDAHGAVATKRLIKE